jgi:hypothetical protein
LCPAAARARTRRRLRARRGADGNAPGVPLFQRARRRIREAQTSARPLPDAKGLRRATPQPKSAATTLAEAARAAVALPRENFRRAQLARRGCHDEETPHNSTAGSCARERSEDRRAERARESILMVE